MGVDPSWTVSRGPYQCFSMCTVSSARGFVLASSAAVVDWSIGTAQEDEDVLDCAAPVSRGTSWGD